MAKVCPECGSTMLVKSGYGIKQRVKVQRYRCNKCLRVFTKPAYTRGNKNVPAWNEEQPNEAQDV